MSKAFEKWWGEKYANMSKPQILLDCFKEIAKAGWDAALESMKKEDELQENNTILNRKEQLFSIISLVFDLPDDTLKAFIEEATGDELNEAESWCIEAYYSASDNIVKVPQMPSCLQKLKDVEGLNV